MTDLHQLILDYEQRTAALLEKAEEVKSQIANLTGSASSSDGAVTASVSAGGALLSLSFGSKADDMPKDRLAALVPRFDNASDMLDGEAGGVSVPKAPRSSPTRASRSGATRPTSR